jgi:hypothetical protein
VSLMPAMNRRVFRRAVSNLMVGLMIGAVILALIPLFFILLNLVLKGAGSLSPEFFTRTRRPRARPEAESLTRSWGP